MKKMTVLMREGMPVRRRETLRRGLTCFRGYSWEERAGVGAVGAGVVGAGAKGPWPAGAGVAGAGVGANPVEVGNIERLVLLFADE